MREQLVRTVIFAGAMLAAAFVVWLALSLAVSVS
jgi:hypothetical protein